jgi:hypothetical protein
MVITKKDMKPILMHLSNKYNIPYNNLLDDIDNILTTNNNINDYNKLKCHAYIMLNGNTVQCSRSKKENCNEFCLTHYRQNNNNTLKYGKIDLEKINNMKKTNNNTNNNTNNITNTNNNNNTKSKVINVEYININDIDYLFNPITKYVYDFETKKKLGKLDNQLNIIKKNKNLMK